MTTHGTVFLEMSMTLDGFVAGPGVSVQEPMGDDRGLIHDWMFAGKTDQRARAWEEEQFAGVGAVIMGHTTFEVGVGPWGDDPAFHAPCFVVSHQPRYTVVRDGGTSYAFVTEGIERAVERARSAAGGKDAMVMGGANLAQQYLRAGLLDELRIHLVDVLLGGGTRSRTSEPSRSTFTSWRSPRAPASPTSDSARGAPREQRPSGSRGPSRLT